ncbi:MAG: glutamate-5-semialdehyde dehydrogenase [Peptostreptococcaceae bacterium]|nr:glutamate-5-semialdehyde dehydrogenase [Peptostreptococcaceae bacterium]
MNYNELTKQIKLDSYMMSSLPIQIRNAALSNIIEALLAKKDDIFLANKEDLESAESNNEPAPILNRLIFDSHKLKGVIDGISSLISLKDPLFNLQLVRELDQGLILKKETCPIGVIGVIFESRPDALVQISTLCIKSGNCSILKGGKEAAKTNKILFDVIYAAGIDAGLPKGFMTLIENRADINELIKCHDSIDLLIPRGSNSFVQYIMSNSKIPVMGHADGVCHIYVDQSADLDKALPVIMDSKAQYVTACNTLETLLVHKDIAAELLPALQNSSYAGNVELRGCPKTLKTIDCIPATEEDFKTEYLDFILSIKIVENLDEAINHINKYGSHHTDCIVTEITGDATKFMALVDSANVYQNCSTRFADGYRYGFGAEVGISTGKLHARGPVGLDGLVTYKYKLFGNGHIVADYVEGRKNFNFVDK